MLGARTKLVCFTRVSNIVRVAPHRRVDVRASLLHYVSPAEVARLVEALDSALKCRGV